MRTVSDDGAAERLRADIASSWRRATATGLDPGAVVDPHEAIAVDATSRLHRAAAPVLDDLAAALDQASYTIILADRDARITDLRVADRSLRPALERVGAVVGRSFTESTTGTNSIATAHELRRGIAVHGDEHYLESFKRFACYGTPIFDTLTGRLAGVLDITCLAEDANELLRPFLLRGARDIEARLFEDASRSQRSLFRAFQDASGRSQEALVALGADLVLTNNAATDLLQPADRVALQVLAADLVETSGGPRHTVLTLVGGASAAATVTGVEGGVLVSLTREQPSSTPVPRQRTHPAEVFTTAVEDELRRCLDDRVSVLVRGEPGTGVTTVAGRLSGGAAVELDCALLTADLLTASVGPSVDATRTAAPDADPPTWSITDLHLLAPDVATLLVRRIDRVRPRLVVTAAGPLTGHAATIASRCPARLELPTLRSRREDIPTLASTMLADASGGRARFTATALRALAASDWPGNLRELRTVVDDVAGRRSAGDVTEADLPVGHRDPGRPQLRGALWQAERDAIMHALRACSGNKVHAAQMLGIARNTLYRRMRTLGVPG